MTRPARNDAERAILCDAAIDERNRVLDSEWNSYSPERQIEAFGVFLDERRLVDDWKAWRRTYAGYGLAQFEDAA